MRLEELAVIELCTSCKDQFISTYFLADKSNREKRFILNLKKLNKFIKPLHFKLEDIRTAIKLIFSGCFMAKIDLKNAYFLVSICPEDRKFLRFSFRDKLFQFTCMPFDLSICPYAFTKLMKPVVNYLHSKGLISVIYLDNLFGIKSSRKECQANVQITCSFKARSSH